jgi:pimeloyl-ACP methyl ester carboxylesterase
MQVRCRTQTLGSVEDLYREAEAASAPVILLLHGFPGASHMFPDLVPRLAHDYRLIAPRSAGI